jgi:mannitol-1-phosphate 5-dehydrogenase
MSERPTVVQFGAGAIGRSFLGQIFNEAGYEVVFVDVDTDLVSELNRRGGYELVIKDAGRADQTIPVQGVRAVDGTDRDAVVREVERCALAATAVGAAGLEKVARPLAEGLARRADAGAALNVILAENVRDAAGIMRRAMAEVLGSAETVDRFCGLVETSIGKMVPLVPAADRERDPLLLYAEPYRTLIVDATAFRAGIPQVPGLKPVEHIGAYVDRKLFIHNLGHAATAYLGYAHDPNLKRVAEAMEIPQIATPVSEAMGEAARALRAAYPGVFALSDLQEHIEELIHRFRNRALGDTLFRVGRDLHRKLSRNDRIIGAMLLAETHGTAYGRIAEVAAAGFRFGATNENGAPEPKDQEVRRRLQEEGLEPLLRELCGLDPNDPRDAVVAGAIREADARSR